MCALDFAIGPSLEIVISGLSNNADTKEMLEQLNKQYIPNKIVILRPAEEESPAITKISEFSAAQLSIDGKATAYVCRNYTCSLPTTDIAQMVKLLIQK
jgi:hypothetical protein